MELIVAGDYGGLSRVGAELIARVIEARPDAAVVPATGNTPMGIYGELAAMRRRGEVDPSRLKVFQLDEYRGIGPDDPRSLEGWLRRSFLEPLGIPEDNLVRLPGDADDPEAACREYDEAVSRAGGYDLAVLGLGPNGHLGYNEPPCDANARTRVVKLTEESIKSSARYWGEGEAVPRHGVTAGMEQLLGARRILLVVSGAHKRDILWRTLKGPVGRGVPSSYLQQAADVTVITDREAWPWESEAR